MSEAPPPAVQSRSSADGGVQTPLSRNIRQLGLFFTGAAFMAASVFVTRRSVVRRQIESFPKFYVSNRSPPRFDSSDRSLLAVQAFGLATLNVMSFGVLLTGGISWGWDLCSMRELRERSQAALRRPGRQGVDPEEEKALKEMMDGLLAKMGMQTPEEGGEGGEKKPEDDKDQS
ncbi:hypothetical protein NLU13_0425 [Sarocladium strictum]|uniref:Altered inheritance of mitochondria protein 11 n=1 Tax=Sarocladium strictum TaxID=5046 RepID=A0AA39GP19_SARSR|nr:hypothetical protein NLU13_0425 [Sarocladium strictum]